jgi:hypothetical protein
MNLEEILSIFESSSVHLRFHKGRWLCVVVVVWYCDVHGPVALVDDRKEVKRHRRELNCGRIFKKKVYGYSEKTGNWYDMNDSLFATEDEFIAFLKMSDEGQKKWIENAPLC